MHRALVQSKLPRDIGRGQIGFRIGDRLQHRDGSIEHLNPITGRRRLEPFSTCRRGLIHRAMIAGFPSDPEPFRLRHMIARIKAWSVR